MLLIIAHSSNRALEEGVLPAAQSLGIAVCIITDCLHEHLLRARQNTLYSQCQLLECDAANPLAIVKSLAIYQVHISAVIAVDASLQSCAAVVAEQAGLTRAGVWQTALLYEQAQVANAHQETKQESWVINAAGPLAEDLIPPVAYPVNARPLECGGLHK